MNTEQKNQELWEIAKKRVGFKKHLLTYVIVNSFLIAIWYFTENQYPKNFHDFWPKWVLLGWGIGLFFNFVNAYVKTDLFSTEKEFEKLKK